MAREIEQQQQSQRTGMMPGMPNPAAQMMPPEVMAELARLMSSHPDPAARELPRFQTNNPINIIDTQPQMKVASNLYLDSAIPYRMPGMVPSPEISQRVVLNRPNLRGIPELMLPIEMANQLAAEAVYTRMGMSGSMQAEMMEQRGGVDTSPGATARKRAR